jgi:tetratricopeptide (TPR) repeat protein
MFAAAILPLLLLMQEPPPAACHDEDAVGWVPVELMQRPITIQKDVGRVHEAVTTKSPEAQAFYDQGLALLHSFAYIDAARSFHQALRHDPGLAMAYVGLSRAYSYWDVAPARDMVAKAEALAGGAAPREQRRVALRRLQVESMTDPGSPAKVAAYKKALEEALVAEYDNVELWLLRGNLEDPYLAAGGIGQMGGLGSIPFYEKVLTMAPDHLAAHHYLVHSNERVGRIDDALRHGARYAALAPGVPHARHMYAHDLRRVGRTREAIAEFEAADALERAYQARESLGPEMDWHHAHNLELLVMSHQQQGEMARVETLMARLNAIRPVTEGRAMNQGDWPAYLLSRGRVADARSAAEAMTRSPWAAGRAMGHLALGEIAVGRKDAAEAERRLAAAEAEAPAVTGVRARLIQGTLATLADRLRGEIWLLGSRRAEGRELIKAAQVKLRARPGPDAWIQTVFELDAIARLAREVGDWELADHTARQLLEHDPGYGGSHYAFALVAAHRGDSEAARKAFEEATRRWEHADESLPELRHARAELARPSRRASTAAEGATP